MCSEICHCGWRQNVSGNNAMTLHMDRLKQTIEEIEDHLMPFLSLNTYEKALYYHLLTVDIY